MLYYVKWSNVDKLLIKNMNVSSSKFKPIDYIAIIIVLGGFVLIYLGADGVVSGILISVVAWYFGKQAVQSQIEKKKLVESVTDVIKRVCKSEFVDPALALRVAQCESSLNPKAISKNSNKSIDRGVFQWNDKWHPEITDICAFDVECATRAFCKAFKGGNLEWWKATKSCWDK